jgi:hypothetical protein
LPYLTSPTLLEQKERMERLSDFAHFSAVSRLR